MKRRGEGSIIKVENEHPLAPQVAVGAIVFKDNKILLVKRNKPPGKGAWAIPGGVRQPRGDASGSGREGDPGRNRTDH